MPGAAAARDRAVRRGLAGAVVALAMAAAVAAMAVAGAGAAGPLWGLVPAAAAGTADAAGAVGAAGANLDPVYAALRGARLDGRVAVVHGLRLERDAFQLELASGALYLVAPVGGRTVGAVFVGQGTLRLRPDTAVERRQLGLYLGEGKDFDALADSFDEMLLLFTDGTAAQIGQAAAIEQRAVEPRVQQVYERWLARQRQDFHLNLQLRLARDLLNHPGQDGGAFLALLAGRRLPPALLAADRDGVGSLVTGFRLGRAPAMLYVPDPRRGGFWYLSDRPGGGDQASGPAVPLAEALGYRVDTTVRRDTDLAGVTTIRLRVAAPGLRLLPIHLAPRLRLAEVSYRELAPGAANGAGPAAAAGAQDGTGPAADPGAPDGGDAAAVVQAPAAASRAAGWVQEDAALDGGDAAIVFPDRLEAGTTLALRLAYQGDAVLRDAGDKNYYVDARASWYPNLGTFAQPAPFQLSYRVPAGNQVISVGRLLSAGDQGGQAVSQWQTDGGIRVAGFNYGRFKKLEQSDEASGVQLQVFTNPGTPDAVRTINSAMRGEPRAIGLLPPGTLYNTAPQASLGVVNTARLAEQAMADGINAARIFTTYFGPLAAPHVAITQQSQFTFGQSWPSLIFMPYLAFLDGTQRQRLGLAGANDFVEQVGFHELAHQWWGHLVGASTYRDVWLEEGFAEFSAALAVQHTLGWNAYVRFWSEARQRLFTLPRHGALAGADAGPIRQGFRLATERSPGAYQAVVYGKGGYVLHMLRMLLWDSAAKEPDHRFVDLMHDYTATFAGKQATTADFQHVVERHMTPAMDAAGDGTMTWFFRQWVEGTETPRYVADLRLQPAGDQLRIAGTIAQQGVGADFHATLPIYLEFPNRQYVRVGTVPVTGSAVVPVDLQLKVPKRPLAAAINARGEVLARD